MEKWEFLKLNNGSKKKSEHSNILKEFEAFFNLEMIEDTEIRLKRCQF